jgi:hypothetical protein
MPLADHIFATRKFDAYEVIGGFPADCDSNTLQAARYYEEVAKAGPLPIVGVTDAHSCNSIRHSDRYYTIVFAPSDDLRDLIGSVKDMYSVAVEYPKGQRPRPVGPIRLVKYALFMEREIFPAHDLLCREEGRLMNAHAMGDPRAAESLAALKGRTAALYDRYWAEG